MKKWIAKAIIQKIISYLPYSNNINFWFQKNITKGVNLTDEHFNDKLVHCSDHISLYKKSLNNLGIDCLELGTGWYPVVPIGLFLAGAKSITSIDLTSLCNKERLVSTIEKFKEWDSKSQLQFYIQDLVPKRLEMLKEISFENDFESLLSQLNIKLIVGDARNIKLDSNSIDFIISNNVFEHIYPVILEPILFEFKRLLNESGKMSHFIDMSDHFAHNDESITIYNYLKYSDMKWSIIDNSVQPQNRMRLPEYIELFEKSNLKYEFQRLREGSKSQIDRVKLDNKYLKFDIKDVMISHVHVILN